MAKLSRTKSGWVVSLLRRRGKSKILPVISRGVTTPDAKSIREAIEEMEQALVAPHLPGGS